MASSYYPLSLHLGVQGWSKFIRRKYDADFRSFALKVHRRDQYRCQYCGFQSGVHMEVINLNNDYDGEEVSMANLITACPFCTQCLFIAMVGKIDYGGGKLIYLPHLSQNRLNALCHVMYASIHQDSDYKSESQNIINLLRLRSNYVEDHVGKGLSEPALMAQMLIDTPIKNKEQVEASILKDLRLLPSRKGFTFQIEQWLKTSMYSKERTG